MASSFAFSDSVCVICREVVCSSDADVSEVNRGLGRLLDYSQKYSDTELHEYLSTSPQVVRVHNSCRRNYTSKRRFEQKQSTSSSAVAAKSLRSSSHVFDWKHDCFFCSQPCLDSEDIRHVETLEIRDSTLEQCKVRADAWGLEVQSRLINCCDLVAEEAVYHKNCHRSFYHSSMHTGPGRPTDSAKQETFEKICKWLEMTDCELLTLQDVVEKAQALQQGSNEVYSEKWIKHKLIERYGDHIQFNEVRGRRNVVCWREMASYIVNEKWHDEQKSSESEHIVVTAAKLLRETIKETSYQMDLYPDCNDVQDSRRAKEWMPSLLALFLEHLICPEEKQISLGHCIVQSVRPRTVIAPIPFALGVSVDHICASKYLVNVLHRLGMSVSYDEVHRFKQSVARSESTDQPLPSPAYFTQYAADNVDHDVCSLDGSGTLHAMGIISISSTTDSTVNPSPSEMPVARLKVVKSVDVAKQNRIPLLPCILPNDSMSGVAFLPHFYATNPCTLSPSVNLDLLWHMAWFLQNCDNLRPSWAGFNSSVVHGSTVKASDIRLRPIIDCNPNDPSCVYSTLVFITKESQKLNIKTPVITFDQPLWLKAVKIVNSYGLDVVCRLGAFHVEMSFLGSLGVLMSGSGLNYVMSRCYGANTVRHIMSGKAVARAVRAHCLIESALTIILLESVMFSGASDINELKAFYSYIVSNGFDEDTEFPPSFHSVENALSELKRNLMEKSRTSKLWLQYMYYVATLKMFLRAERTADWLLHLFSIRRMIHLFAATGHGNYAKCARLYVEMMSHLPDTHPDLYNWFMSGAHIARRSSKPWGGLSIDLTIEQAMMRTIKGQGGLTHGRGVSESVRATWISTVHKTAAVKTALSQFTDTEYCHDMVQHPELGQSREKRDTDDLRKLLEFLRMHNPFETRESRLQCLTSGIAAAESDRINCDDVEEVGACIVGRMNGLPYSEVSLKRKDQIRTLEHITSTARASDRKGITSVDPTILFNRLLVIVQRSPDIEKYFSYELSAHPASLFRDKDMRKTDKSQLAKELHKFSQSSQVPPLLLKHVVDGGYLLHVVCWNTDASYGDVAQQYVAYVDRHFGESSVIVFDGYCDGPSTKDHEHQRRAKRYAPDVVVDPVRTAYHDQSSFLSNDRNKGGFVALLISYLKAAGYTVHQAPDDADTLIAKVALECAAAKQPVRLVANDTDILVMLVYHYKPHMANIFMKGSAQGVHSVRDIWQGLGPSVSRLIAIHAISGCDTTSGLYGHGKVSTFKKLTQAGEIQSSIDVLESSVSSHQEVMEAGCGLLSLLYGGACTDKLNRLRYSMYMHAAATHAQLPRPERLPPTENAARFHIYRVHLQIVQWKMLSTSVLNPLDWGWALHEGRYIPVANDIDIAPPDILKVACCKCSVEASRPCGTRACMCVKYGLACISACKSCGGVSCENVQESVLNHDDVSDETQMPDSDDYQIVDDECVEYYMPWVVEEEVELSI